MGAELLVTVVDQLASGTALEEPQSEPQATYAPRLTKEEGLIDWTRPAAQIHNQVRGLYPWPHAFSFLSGARLIIRRSRVLPNAETHSAPGTVTQIASDVLVVATGEGQLGILEVQPEGRRPMSVRDFMAGHRLSPGDVFSSS